MHARSFRFDTTQLHGLFAAPRKPRMPLLRVALGLVGLALLAVLVFFGVFIGAAMLAGEWPGACCAGRRRAGRRPARSSTPITG